MLPSEILPIMTSFQQINGARNRFELNIQKDIDKTIFLIMKNDVKYL